MTPSEQTRRIEDAAAGGATQAELAHAFGVSRGVVAGAIYRARRRGDLPVPWESTLPDVTAVPTPDPFPPKGCCLFSLRDGTFCGARGNPWCPDHRKIVYKETGK